MGFGGKGKKGKGQGKPEPRPYRGSRAGAQVQEKRRRNQQREWEEQGWQLQDDGSWVYVGIPEGEEEQEDVRSRSPSVRLPSLAVSRASDDIRRELDEALRLAQREAAARKEFEQRLSALEAAAGLRAPTYAPEPEGGAYNPPAPESEAAPSEVAASEAKSQALSGSHDSQRSQRSARLSEGAESEAMVMQEPLFPVAEEPDFSRESSRKPTPTQSPRVLELQAQEMDEASTSSNMRLLPREPPYPPPVTYKSVAAKGATKGQEKGKGTESERPQKIQPIGKAKAALRAKQVQARKWAEEEAEDLAKAWERRHDPIRPVRSMPSSSSRGPYAEEETRRAHYDSETAARSLAARYSTDPIRWPHKGEVRRIAIDFHGVLQIKTRGQGWQVPALHIELLKALQDNGWRVFCISWVGSDRRARSTWAEMQSSGVIDTLGAHSCLLITPDQGERGHKATVCEGNSISIMIDDSPEVFQACTARNIAAIPIQGGQPFPEEIEVYRDLAQALHIEGILFKRRLADR